MVQNMFYLGECSLCIWKDVFCYCMECHIKVIYQICLTILFRSFILNDFLFVSSATEKVILKSPTIVMDFIFFQIFSLMCFEVFLKHFCHMHTSLGQLCIFDALILCILFLFIPNNIPYSEAYFSDINRHFTFFI